MNTLLGILCLEDWCLGYNSMKVLHNLSFVDLEFYHITEHAFVEDSWVVIFGRKIQWILFR